MKTPRLLISSFADGHLAGFHLWATVHNAAVDRVRRYLLVGALPVSGLEVELPDLVVILLLLFDESPNCHGSCTTSPDKLFTLQRYPRDGTEHSG